MMPSFVEFVMILSVSLSLPTLAMAMWYGWKIELHRSENEPLGEDRDRP